MTRRAPGPPRGRLRGAAGITASVALLAAACGGVPDEPEPPIETETPGPPGVATISVEQAPKYGEVLVDDRGMALYLFVKDPEGSSTCYDACVEAWPPVATDKKPEAVGDARTDLLSTITRKNGDDQVTYAGHPLYYYAPDNRDTYKGQDLAQFGAEWYLVAPSGEAVKSAQGGTDGTTTTEQTSPTTTGTGETTTGETEATTPTTTTTGGGY